jgi:secreted trypsin-like serine protease
MRTKRNVFKQLIMVVAVLFLANACADYGINEGQGQYSDMNQLIIGGDRATASSYNAVVSLHETSPTGVYVYPFCTGTLIDDDVVLTAAHCLDVGRRKPRTMSPDSLMIYIGISPVEAFDAGTLSFSDFLYVSETKIHGSYDSRRLINDIAILRLAAPVTDVTPIPALPASEGFTSADIGATLNFARPRATPPPRSPTPTRSAPASATAAARRSSPAGPSTTSAGSPLTATPTAPSTA